MNRQKGFSLLEMLMVVSIIGILAAIAFPSYEYSVRKTNRGAAQSVLMDVAQREQQYFLDARSYLGAGNAAALVSNLHVVIPTGVTTRYTFAVTTTAVAGSPPTFTATATAIGKQASDGSMSINETGTKTPADKW